jgi:hypothetical protein
MHVHHAMKITPTDFTLLRLPLLCKDVGDFPRLGLLGPFAFVPS